MSAVKNALRAVKSPWTLVYTAMIHSSQELTISDTIVCEVDIRIEWSNLVYLAAYRVRRINQLRKIVLDDNNTTISYIVNDKIIDDIIRTNFPGINNRTKNNREFNIDAELIIALREQHNNYCASCNCKMRWQYSDKDPHQFTVDRIKVVSFTPETM